MTMKDRFNDLWKGFILGLDTTIPGFSIGTLAIILGIYERMIDGLSNLVSHPWRVIKEDFMLVIGFIVGLILDIIVISYLLERFPLQTVFTFVGLILVSIPSQLKSGINSKQSTVDKKPKFRGEIITAVISLLILVGVTLLNGTSGVKEATLSPGYIIAMLFCGAIGAGLMIVPGVSGSLLIMALGYYDNILIMLKDFGKSIINGNFDNFWINSLYIGCFIIGCLAGLVGISKAIKKLLSVKPSYVYFAILGLLIGSPFAIIYLTLNNYTINYKSPYTYIVSIITFLIGGLFAYYVKKIENKHNEETGSLDNLDNK